MKRSATILIAALSALAAAAGEVVSVGTDGSQDFSYHARYALHGNGKHALGMYWDCADTLHYELIAEIDNSAFNDAMYPAKVRYTITKKSAPPAPSSRRARSIAGRRPWTMAFR